MPTSNSSNLTSLEVVMWRPTPERPDRVAAVAGAESGTSFSALESFKSMFSVARDQNTTSEQVSKHENPNCNFDACMSHRVAANGKPREIELKTKITTSVMTEAALSVQLSSWRPTPERPDYTENYNAYFLLGAASAEESAVHEVKPVAGNNFNVTFQLKQLAFSGTARILELTVSATLL